MNNSLTQTIATALLLASFSIQAEEWRYSFTPYVWATDLDTTAGNEQASANSVIDFDDLLSIADAAWMSMQEARYGNWSVMSDIVYMKISEGASGNGHLDFVAANLDARLEQANVDLFAGYTPDNSNTTFFAGVRYLYLKAEADLSITTPLPIGSLAKSGSRDEDWIDPIVGVRHIARFSDNLGATVQLDAGGGLDSEFSAVGTATLDYYLNPDTRIRAGYRYARIDKDDDELLFDQTADGALVGIAIGF